MRKNNKHIKIIQKNEKQMRLKNSKGITLIALVVTIIVLLILAGITINFVIGENGIFNVTNTAKIKTEEAYAKEKLQTVLTNIKMKKIVNNNLEYETLLQKYLPDAEILDDIIIIDNFAFQIDKDTLNIIASIGTADNIIRPNIEVTVNVREDKKEVELQISTQESTNGIEKIEVVLGKNVVETYEYEWEKEPINQKCKISYNGKYIVKVYSKLPISKIVEINQIIEDIKFSPNGNESYQKQETISLTVDETVNKVIEIKYVWSQSAITAPNTNEFVLKCKNKESIQNSNTLNGQWYLWALVKFDNGQEFISRSNVYHFDNEGPEVSVLSLNSDEKANKLKIEGTDQYSNIKYFEIFINNEFVKKEEAINNSAEFEYNDEEWKNFNITVKGYDELENYTTSQLFEVVPEYKWQEYGVKGTNTWKEKIVSSGVITIGDGNFLTGTACKTYYINQEKQIFKTSTSLKNNITNFYDFRLAGWSGGETYRYLISTTSKKLSRYGRWVKQSTGSYRVDVVTYELEYDAISADTSNELSSIYSIDKNLHENNMQQGESFWKITSTRWKVV